MIKSSFAICAIQVAAVAAVVAPLVSGCAVHESAQVSATPPPPPQVDVKVSANPPAPPPPPMVEAHAPPPPPPPDHTVAPVAPMGEHPHYLKALSDLRYARACLQNRPGDRAVKWDEAAAIGEVDAAIGEIKHAAVDDGKNLEDHPAIDVKVMRAGLLRQALQTLTAAREDITHEDERWGNGLRMRAAHHIDEAVRLTELGIRQSH